jgi:hypothetical protein
MPQGKPPKKSRVMTKIGVIILTILLCLVILEIGLRLLGRQPTNMADGIAKQYGDSFKLKENVKKVIKFPAFSYTVYTDEYGFRDKTVGAKNLVGKPFCVFLGASDVFGNGLEYENSFVGIYAEAASRKGIETLNLAVGGHYFLDQESLLKDFISNTKHTPSVVFFCVNALHIPKFDQRNKNILVKNGYTIDRQGWQVAYLRLMAGNISSAFCLFRDAIRRIQERWLKYEVTEKSPEFLQVYSKGNKIREPSRIKNFENYLAGFETFCRQNDIEIVYVYLPLSDSFRIKDMVKQIGADPDAYDAFFYEELMRSHCEKSKTKLVNVRPALQRYYEEGKELRFKLDPHFNAFANRIIGEYLIKELL